MNIIKKTKKLILFIAFPNLVLDPKQQNTVLKFSNFIFSGFSKQSKESTSTILIFLSSGIKII